MSSSTSASVAPSRIRLLPSSLSTLDMRRCESIPHSKVACRKDVRVLACAKLVNDVSNIWHVCVVVCLEL